MSDGLDLVMALFIGFTSVMKAHRMAGKYLLFGFFNLLLVANVSVFFLFCLSFFLSFSSTHQQLASIHLPSLFSHNYNLTTQKVDMFRPYVSTTSIVVPYHLGQASLVFSVLGFFLAAFENDEVSKRSAKVSPDVSSLSQYTFVFFCSLHHFPSRFALSFLSFATIHLTPICSSSSLSLPAPNIE